MSPGALFSPTGEHSEWQRINVAYAADQRALALFRAAGPARSTSDHSENDECVAFAILWRQRLVFRALGLRISLLGNRT